MKFLRFIIGLFLVLALLAAGLYFTGNAYLIKGVWATYLHGHTSATITDKKFFDLRAVPTGVYQPWAQSRQYNQQELSDKLQETLKETESIAFLVIKNDSILQEHYWKGFSDSSRTNSFSMAKSITAMLAQIAIQKAYLKSWDDQVADYLPALQGAYRDELRLKHLADMTAGLRWEEDYQSPFDITARAYYGPNVKELILEEVPVVAQPGQSFNYQSGASQLLGLVLTQATGMTLSEMASRWLWKPMGARHKAQWHLDDEEGHELSYCCFNSNARDFARFGKLLLHQGKWEGLALLDSSFVNQATQPQNVPHYGRSFWLDSDDHLTPVFYMRGIGGQYVIIIPEKDIVIVRLGHERMNKTRDEHPEDFHIYVEEVLKYLAF